MIGNWSLATIQALENLWQGFLNFVPALIGAIIVFVIGWFIGIGIGKSVAGILKKLRFNQFFEKGVWQSALEKAELKIDAAGFVGVIFKWIIVLVFLMAAVDILGLKEFAIFLKSILGYLPNVIVAVLIFVAAIVIADLVEKIVRVAVESTRVGYGHLVGVIVRWSIWIFAILAILTQLKIEAADWVIGFVRIIFVGIVAMAAIAFGLGGKDVAAEILQDLRRRLKG